LHEIAKRKVKKSLHHNCGKNGGISNIITKQTAKANMDKQFFERNAQPCGMGIFKATSKSFQGRLVKNASFSPTHPCSEDPLHPPVSM
jgi:hypothetical protein